MRIFVIADGSKRKAKPIGTLVWDDDVTGGQGHFTLELSSECNASALPLSLSFCADHPGRTATPEESEAWVRSRIVPEDRHNIVEVLRANGMGDYDEVELLARCGGRSSDDDYLVYEVPLPESAARQRDATGLPGDGQHAAAEQSGISALHADGIIAALERRRNAGQVEYAFVKLPDAHTREERGKGEGGIEAGGNTAPVAYRAGIQVRDWRKRAGLTQAQLAAKAGITQSVLSRVESGKGNPTLSLLEDLASALDTKLEVSFVR